MFWINKNESVCTIHKTISVLYDPDIYKHNSTSLFSFSNMVPRRFSGAWFPDGSVVNVLETRIRVHQPFSKASFVFFFKIREIDCTETSD